MAERRGIVRLVRLILDRRSARQVEEDVKASGDRQTRVLSDQFRRLGQTIAGVFSIVVITRFAREMFNLGAAVAETASKFRTTFGAAAADLDAFFTRFARGAGLTRREARDMAATVGAIAQGMGAARDESAAFSERVLRLAGDLQSFHNVPIEETFQAIRSFLTGETEPMKRFGVVVSAAETELRALRDTGKGSRAELSQMEIAQARLNLMFERAGVAVGDLDRTIDSQANTARAITARYRDWKDQIATGLLPVFSIFLSDLQRGTGALEDHKSATERFLGGVRDFVGGLRSLAAFIGAVFESIPIRFERFLGRQILKISIWANDLERIINRVRIAAGEETIDISSGLIETGRRMVHNATADMQALAAEYEATIARIVAAATVLEDTTPPTPPLPIVTPTTPRGTPAVTPSIETRPLLAQAEAALQPATELVTAIETMGARVFDTHDAFQSTFELIHNGSEAAAKSLGQIGVAMAMSGEEGVKRLAESKVGENVARGIEEVALGIGRAAMGDAAGATAHFNSAAQHGAAAAAWGALAGASGGGGSPALGGGGSFAPQSGADLGGDAAERADLSSIVIFVDPFDPRNPVHQRQMGEAVRNAADRGIVVVPGARS